jgi:ring-1,2-phenylacetyl-CoA epoxidase subunit PaaC
MPTRIPNNIPSDPLLKFLVTLADDELILGHRNSEWTGHAPILEEDIAFSNIAQDELGHSLALYTLFSELSGTSPDKMVFDRAWQNFACCRFVTYPKGDFAYTVVRQYLFDEAEHVRMNSLRESSYEPLSGVAQKILSEEAYHLMHSKGLVVRLGDATEESHRRMQEAVTEAFPQALGMFEKFAGEAGLVKDGVIKASDALLEQWLDRIVPTLTEVTLKPEIRRLNGTWDTQCKPDEGGRQGRHTEHLKALVADLQSVYQTAPGSGW